MRRFGHPVANWRGPARAGPLAGGMDLACVGLPAPMTEIPLRSTPRPKEPYVVRWPGGPSRADCWEDSFWEARAEEGGVTRFRTLFDAYEDAVRDPAARDRFHALAAELGLDGPPVNDPSTPAWGGPTCSLDELVRLTADHWPAVGMEGTELVLGQASLFAGPERSRVAVAGCCFLWAHRRWPSVFTAWCRTGKPRPDELDRQRIRTVALAPWALWRVVHREDGVHLEDHTGLGPAYLPRGPVRIVGEAPTGEGLAARVLRDDRGWVAHTALSVPRLPEPRTVQAWIHDELVLARTFQPELRIEPLLRHRAILVRRVL